MRYLLVLLLLVPVNDLFAQMPNIDRAIAAFDKALVNKDSTELIELLSDDVTYGHSNGWVQTKKEVIGDLYNGILTYRKLRQSNEDLKIYGNTAFVRTDADIEVEMNGNPIKLKLKVLQVWMLVDGIHKQEWKLFARQSTKI